MIILKRSLPSPLSFGLWPLVATLQKAPSARTNMDVLYLCSYKHDNKINNKTLLNKNCANEMSLKSYFISTNEICWWGKMESANSLMEGVNGRLIISQFRGFRTVSWIEWVQAGINKEKCSHCFGGMVQWDLWHRNIQDVIFYSAEKDKLEL